MTPGRDGNACAGMEMLVQAGWDGHPGAGCSQRTEVSKMLIGKVQSASPACCCSEGCGSTR